MAQPAASHFFRNLLLLVLSLLLLPMNTFIISVIYLGHKASTFERRGKASPPPRLSTAEDSKKCILITGVNMAKGLFLARLFHRAGHRVIGADCQVLSIGRVSSAIDKFCLLPPAGNDGAGSDDLYLEGLLAIVEDHNVDLWVSVSDVNAAVLDASAKELIEAKTSARAVQFGVKETLKLHEKHSLIDHIRGLGLTVPETELVSHRQTLIDFLKARDSMEVTAGQARYLLKPIGVDDVARLDMPLLPLATKEATLDRIAQIQFREDIGAPQYILQEYIQGCEYCTHALVIGGVVRAFVACESSDMLMHYVALPQESPLVDEMLEFTKKVAAAEGPDFTGHLSFDFLVRANDVRQSENGGAFSIYPIECNPRVHTAVLLFRDTPGLADAYLDACLDFNEKRCGEPLTPKSPLRYYWIGQEAVQLVLYPLCLAVSRLSISPSLREGYRTLVEHIQCWKDGTFETWDPWPWWWMYHVYWPSQFARYMFRGRWKKINISTGKAFQAA